MVYLLQHLLPEINYSKACLLSKVGNGPVPFIEGCLYLTSVFLAEMLKKPFLDITPNLPLLFHQHLPECLFLFLCHHRISTSFSFTIYRFLAYRIFTLQQFITKYIY